MVYDEKNPHNNEWNIYYQDNSEALHNRKMVTVMIQQKDKRAKPQSNYYKDNTSDKFPFPCNEQNSDQNIGRSEMNQKVSQLLPDGESGGKGIECKHADKKNSHNTGYPGQPMK